MAVKHYVHRFKHSHDTRRRVFKKYLKQGIVKLVKRDYLGWLYEETLGNSIRITNKGKVILTKYTTKHMEPK